MFKILLLFVIPFSVGLCQAGKATRLMANLLCWPWPCCCLTNKNDKRSREIIPLTPEREAAIMELKLFIYSETDLASINANTSGQSLSTRGKASGKSCS